MTEDKKAMLICLLEEYHAEEKENAKAKGAWPKDKVVEECCEVIIDHAKGYQTTGEELDLLMCLVDRYIFSHMLLHRWKQKLMSRGRQLTVAQSYFFDWYK